MSNVSPARGDPWSQRIEPVQEEGASVTRLLARTGHDPWVVAGTASDTSITPCARQRGQQDPRPVRTSTRWEITRVLHLKPLNSRAGFEGMGDLDRSRPREAPQAGPAALWLGECLSTSRDTPPSRASPRLRRPHPQVHPGVHPLQFSLLATNPRTVGQSSLRAPDIEQKTMFVSGEIISAIVLFTPTLYARGADRKRCFRGQLGNPRLPWKSY